RRGRPRSSRRVPNLPSCYSLSSYSYGSMVIRMATAMDPLREMARRHGPRRALTDRSAGFWISWFDLDGLAHAWAKRFEAVGLALANHAASARGCAQALGATEADRWLLCLSPHHVGGLAIFLRSVLCNQPVVTVARFDEAPVLEAIRADRPTLVSLVPTMLV